MHKIRANHEDISSLNFFKRFGLNSTKPKGLFIWAEVIPVNEKTFQLAKYFSSVHMEKHYPAYREKFPAVT